MQYAVERFTRYPVLLLGCRLVFGLGFQSVARLGLGGGRIARAGLGDGRHRRLWLASNLRLLDLRPDLRFLLLGYSHRLGLRMSGFACFIRDRELEYQGLRLIARLEFFDVLDCLLRLPFLAAVVPAISLVVFRSLALGSCIRLANIGLYLVRLGYFERLDC